MELPKSRYYLTNTILNIRKINTNFNDEFYYKENLQFYFKLLRQFEFTWKWSKKRVAHREMEYFIHLFVFRVYSFPMRLWISKTRARFNQIVHSKSMRLIAAKSTTEYWHENRNMNIWFVWMINLLDFISKLFSWSICSVCIIKIKQVNSSYHIVNDSIKIKWLNMSFFFFFLYLYI